MSAVRHSPLFQQAFSPDALFVAWMKVRKAGRAPGLDEVTLPAFERHLDRELGLLAQELMDGSYRPWPARAVMIPKADGSGRRIGVQAVRDRVAQRALLAVLGPRVETILEDCSFAFRPRRSVEGALARLDGWRQEGMAWVARADIRLCFDSLDRARLERALGPVLQDADATRLVDLWLNAGAADGGGWSDPGAGVPQGDVLSPLLCNLYLDAFDEAVERSGHRLVRYADDFVIGGPSQSAVLAGLDRATGALDRLGLELNSAKSWVGTFTQGFPYLGAMIVGSMRLPLHRTERPGGPPRFDFGYGPPSRQGAAGRPEEQAAPGPPPEIPFARSERALRERISDMIRAERKGQRLPAVGAAVLDAWLQAGFATGPCSARRIREEWESVYLI